MYVCTNISNSQEPQNEYHQFQRYHNGVPHSLGEKDENVNYACSFILFALHGTQYVICEGVYSMLHTLGRMQCCLE